MLQLQWHIKFHNEKEKVVEFNNSESGSTHVDDYWVGIRGGSVDPVRSRIYRLSVYIYGQSGEKAQTDATIKP